MKVRAVRLQEVGCFVDPVAIENFDDGLNVLAGPNELGKSTFFRALRALFRERFHANNAQTKALRSLVGGGPVGYPIVEVDFEARGQLWRMHKRFAASKTANNAVLKDLTRNSLVARGVDAEDRLRCLVDASGNDGACLGLLWVEQAAFEPENPTAHQETALRLLIEHEVDTVIVGERFRRLQATVQNSLDELVSPGKRRAPRGAYKEALDFRDTLLERLKEAQEAADRATRRLDCLERLQRRRAELLDPVRLGERRAQRAQVTEALREANITSERLAQVEFKLKAAELDRKSAQDDSERFLASRRILNHLQAAALEAEAAEEEAKRALGQAKNNLVGAREIKERQDIEAADAYALLNTIGEFERAEEAGRRLAVLKQRFINLETARVQLDAGKARLSQNHATPERLKRLRILEGQIREGTAGLNAAAPKISIKYEADAKGIVLVDGEAAVDGQIIHASQPIELSISNLGTISVQPGALSEFEDERRDLHARCAERDVILTSIGVSNLLDAEMAGEELRVTENATAQARERIRLLAPNGRSALKEEIEQLEAVVLQMGRVIDLTDRKDAEKSLTEKKLAQREADQLLERAREEVVRAEAGLHALTAQSEERRKEIALRSSELPPAQEWEKIQAKLEVALAKNREAERTVLKSVEFWRAEAPDADAIAQLELRVQRANAQERNAEQALRDIDAEILTLDVRLDEAGEAGVGERVAELEGQLARVEVQIARLEADIAALDLLSETLRDVQCEARETYLQPLRACLTPYLGMVLPEAQLEMSDNFGVSQLTRSGLNESVERLSDGTREQIAILVRLGFARLFADRQRPAPLILDDALVFSDDHRIERVFDALALAAKFHQVVVLTCRERTFESLGGHRLQIASKQFS